MPEIRNEVPSDEELWAYLDESLASSPLFLLTDLSRTHPQLQGPLDQASAAIVACPLYPALLTTIRDVLIRSLQRLNALPRSDPFWINTNLRPTVFKLPEFCARIVQREPDDVLSLWTMSALQIAHWGNFDPGHWAQLYRLSEVSLDMAAFAAMVLEAEGSPTSEDFAEFLMVTGNHDAIGSLLAETVEDGGELLSDWRNGVLISLRAK